MIMNTRYSPGRLQETKDSLEKLTGVSDKNIVVILRAGLKIEAVCFTETLMSAYESKRRGNAQQQLKCKLF
jgi:hypothetical protein